MRGRYEEMDFGGLGGLVYSDLEDSGDIGAAAGDKRW